LLVQIFKNPKPDFIKALEDAGLATGENGVKRGLEPAKKRKGKDRNV
jgi:hypothetical protein